MTLRGCKQARNAADALSLSGLRQRFVTKETNCTNFHRSR
ncbi:hypothetical protein HMPREF9347_02890 [Escherichia coli MS 124-1]|nr:hypothetical protein HMPREF9553_01444 [Escherichia coli MS 200-1]EFJ90495.1 hypothetical protein HMPREF9531_04438 [Escherichia coli MS 45-1]EFK68171.1 hypothetical protein HMPREF9347_02890 [Escherichia coli MS 124-1]EFO60047.1 hypothetical protein HMPREF9348_00995 [Escherichia coli MS 145-7]EFU60122.1 hypothetical protein HMPREF9545_00014 [Escherichia coli MS 16-3]ESC99515.1 hypothetical protein HMPREF1594_01466 [Escherichia coli 907446]ESD17638.1 hypothetical protein HMPREF1597_03906 [Esc